MGCVGVETPTAKQWEEFGPEVLGLELADRADDGAVLLRMDDRHHRFAFREGQANRLSYIGWELATESNLDAAADELARAGIDVERADEELCAARAVSGMVSFSDPFGISHELFYGQLEFPDTFRPLGQIPAPT